MATFDYDYQRPFATEAQQAQQAREGATRETLSIKGAASAAGASVVAPARLIHGLLDDESRPALLALAAMGAAAGGRDVTLLLPRTPRAGDTVFVKVDVGAIGAGQEIDVQMSSGERLGTISPYGVKSGRAAGTYMLPVPVPADAVCGRRLALRITITQAGRGARAPEPREVPDVRAVLH